VFTDTQNISKNQLYKTELFNLIKKRAFE